MSINHLSSDLPEAVWWAQLHPHTTEPPSSSMPNTTPTAATNFWANSQLYGHPISANKPMSCAQNSAFNFDLNNEDDEEITIDDERQLNHSFSTTKAAVGAEQEITEIPKEPLFEKPLTPSDVGKLNRLVIPKQHAEKYFPLSGNGNDSGEKGGLLLSFEDESGKPWRFRYSYWNSSQSYVLTKGWSRFVKEKRLDAGDIVLFERHRLDGDRLFIGWRRRTAAAAAGGNPAGQESTSGIGQAAGMGGGGGGGGWTRVYFPPGHPYPAQQQQQQQQAHHHGPAFPYQPDCLHAAAAVLHNQTTATSANSKRLRLFGVNLECQQQPDQYSESSEPLTPPEGSSSTWIQLNQGQGEGHAQAHHQFQYYPKVHHAYFDHHNHMDINFSRDANQTRYRQG